MDVALLVGTRLDIAVKEHRKIVGRLAQWRDQLVHLQRCPISSNASLDCWK